MGKYDFRDLYKDCTLLDQDFLRNEFGFDIGVAEDEILYKNYYNYICGIVNEHNIFQPTSNEIEEILNNGYARRFAIVCSGITRPIERKYKFLMAQAHQLKYDKDNGRNSMIRGENGEYDVSRDTMRLLNELGLIREMASFRC